MNIAQLERLKRVAIHRIGRKDFHLGVEFLFQLLQVAQGVVGPRQHREDVQKACQIPDEKKHDRRDFEHFKRVHVRHLWDHKNNDSDDQEENRLDDQAHLHDFFGRAQAQY